jgi:hypothetical protein
VSAFTPQQLVAAAKTRYGASILQGRMRGAAGNSTAADAELVKIANGVISRIIAACAPSVGWPLPGVWPAGSVDDDGVTNISGTPYTNIWPKNLLQVALDLFNWRTLSGLDEASSQQRLTGQAAEQFFQSVEEGTIGLGLSVNTEVSPPEPFAARNRDGTSNVDDVPDREPVTDTFSGRAWNGS